MTDYGEGQTGKGLFSSASGGRAFNNHRRRRLSSIDHFAQLLSEHIDDQDLAAGRNLATGEALPAHAQLDLGGNVASCARRLGLKPANGNGLLQRIRQRLGDQAR